jgi:hypothetical protein
VRLLWQEKEERQQWAGEHNRNSVATTPFSSAGVTDQEALQQLHKVKDIIMVLLFSLQ